MANQTVNSDSNASSDTHISIPPMRANLLLCLFTLLIAGLLGGIVLWSLNKLPVPIAIAAGVIWLILIGISGFLADAYKNKLFSVIGSIYSSANHHLLSILAGAAIALILSLVPVLLPFLYTDPYIHRGLPALDDPLQFNGPNSAWDEKEGRCEFAYGQFQVSEPHQDNFYACYAHATNYRNFIYQVQMTIIEGDCGAIIFRHNEETAQQYFFQICQDGSYILIRYDALSSNGPTGQLGHKLDSQLVNPAIHKGLNQTNLVAVVADGSNIDLWVNGSHVSSVVDTAYMGGGIGLAANDLLYPTKVVFRNVKVWTF